jgi:hypothetical protein
MNLTKKNFKLTKKTLFLFKKQPTVLSLNYSSDPITVTATTPLTSLHPETQG